MGILLLRDSTAATTSSNSDDVGKNVGIVLGCLAVLAVLLPIISRSCGCFGRRPPTELPVHSISPASRRRHLNAAEIMRLCAIRDSTRPLPPKPKKRSLLSVSEVDLAAPKLSYGDLLAREPAVETVTVPPRALMRENATQPAANTETPGSTGAEKNTLTAIDSVEQGDHAVCSICLEDFEDADSVRETICHHVFHSCCLEQWLTKRRSHCPLCQGDLKLKREEC